METLDLRSAAGVVVLLAIAVVVSVVPWETLFSNTNGDKQAQPNPPKQKTSDTSKKNDPPDKQPKPRRGVFQPIEPIDAVQLRKQIDGPHHNAVFPQSQRTITVSRAQRDDCAHTIADALARAPANSATTIALQDNGPLFAQSLPVIANKTIIIQGKTGLSTDTGMGFHRHRQNKQNGRCRSFALKTAHSC